MGRHVLLIEDNEVLQGAMVEVLKKHCTIMPATNLKIAAELLEKETIDLILLDLHLPDGDGIAFCSGLKNNRRFADIPVMIISGNGAIDDREQCFELGVEDFILKPVNMRDLVARVKAKLKSIESNQDKQESFTRSNFRVDMVAQKVFHLEENGERLIDATPIEFKLFVHFLRNPGKIFTRDELRTAIWGPNHHLSSHTVDTHISSLRKKLGDMSTALKSVVKKGYCLELPESDKIKYGA